MEDYGKNHLPDAAYRCPESFSMSMSKKQLHETLLATGGRILACGTSFDVKSEHLGVGVYRITLKRKA